MRRLILVTALLAVAVLLSLFAYSCSQKKNSTVRYDNIEVFDINKEQIIKKVPSNAAMQKEAEKYLNGITSLYVKVNPIPTQGTMIKVPLEPPVKVQNQWLDAAVDQLILIFPVQGEPYLMVFYSGGSPLFFNFKGDTQNLLKYLNIKP